MHVFQQNQQLVQVYVHIVVEIYHVHMCVGGGGLCRE